MRDEKFTQLVDNVNRLMEINQQREKLMQELMTIVVRQLRSPDADRDHLIAVLEAFISKGDRRAAH